jgi:hypothetical protein
VESVPTIWSWPPEIRVEAESLFAPTENGVPSVEPPPTDVPPPPPQIPLTPMELVDQIFGWPGAQLVACESSWNRWAVGRFGERGLFQIHPVHRYGIVARMGYSWDDMFEVEPNIRVAVEIRYAQGLRAWTCWRG